MATPLRRLIDATVARRTASDRPEPDTAEEHPMTDDPEPTTVEDRPLPATSDALLHEGQRHELGDVRRLRIRIARGDVDVIGRDEPGATVAVRTAGRPVPVRLDEGLLRIGESDGGGHAVKASITVTVHREAAVRIDGTSASVLVSGMKHGVEVRTVSGDVVCDATAGTARLEGVSAELALREHEGPVGIETVSGPATVSGAVTRLDHSGVSGELFLDLEGPDRVDVRTVSGRVVLRLGAERSTDYAIDTVSGELHVDGTDLRRAPGGYRGRWDGPVDDLTAVRVSTSSGSVRIVHADTT